MPEQSVFCRPDVLGWTYTLSSKHVHRLSKYFCLCRPLARLPSTFPVTTSASIPCLLMTCPKKSSCLCLIVFINVHWNWFSASNSLWIEPCTCFVALHIGVALCVHFSFCVLFLCFCVFVSITRGSELWWCLDCSAACFVCCFLWCTSPDKIWWWWWWWYMDLVHFSIVLFTLYGNDVLLPLKSTF